MKRILAWTTMVAFLGAPVMAANLDLTVRRASDGSSSITVGAGEVVHYEIVGLLTSDADNEGLALAGFDLDLDGANCGGPANCDLPPADIPTGDPSVNPMVNFFRPLGITNPDDNCPPACGGAGTVINGNLVQCLGGQNTINNTAANAPFPVGGVVTALGHTPVVLLTGQFTAPAVAGDYTLAIPPDSVFANVIKMGEMCDPDPADPLTFCATEAVPAGTIVNLAIHVFSLPGLTASVPGCDKSLWRSANNIVRLTFDGDITAPGPGEVLIQPLDPVNPGGFLGDLSGSFSFTVENDGGGNPRILRINETVPALTHKTWIAIRNAGGWTAAADFEVDYRVLVGDVNDDGRVLSTDVGEVNPLIPCFVGCGDDNRADVNGDGRVLSTDVGAVNLNIPVFNLEKPPGHACVPAP